MANEVDLTNYAHITILHKDPLLTLADAAIDLPAETQPAIAATLNCRHANRVIVKAPRRNLEVVKVRIHHRKKCSLTIFKVSTFDVSFQFVSS